jgi:hypothetical protein
VQLTADDHIQFRLNYTGPEDHKLWALGLFAMLLACSTMEQTLFGDYEGRLMLIKRYKVEPPSGIYPPPAATNLQAIRITRGPFGGHLFSRASSCNQKKQRTQKREPSAPEGGGKPAAAFGRPFPHSQGGVHYPFP